MIKKNIFWIFFLSFTVSCGTSKSLKHLPEIASYSLEIPKIHQKNDSLLYFKDNFFVKNKQQLWELYLTGNPLQIGYNNGALTQKIMQKQEKIFFSKVEEFVPSKFKQGLLRSLLKWYNRKMYLHVRNDFQAEIYGLSQYSSHEYDFVAPPFLRSMYLHAAHDIGHAMQDMMIVGCSSLAVWDENSEDGNLLIGRNFDFYAGDDFAKEKIIAFVKPENAIPYMSVTWGGMTGVVSGMNMEGITVTINAGKSKIPLVAKTPISLVTKEILMFAKNIEEAIAIAKKRNVFVSESIMVGSAKDRKAVLIEVSPDNFGVFEVENSSQLICTNHFQSEAYKNDERNNKQIAESHSEYRYERLQELLQKTEKLNPPKMAEILRNKNGLKEIPLGFGNEKAINQLLAHHAIIFSPEKKLVWVSSNPYQLGEFVGYDLNEIFNENPKPKSLETGKLNIPRDSFADSEDFKKYEEYRKTDREIDEALENKKILTEDFIKNYKLLNPDLWSVYYKTGKYHYQNKNYSQAKTEFQTALTKVITTFPDRKNVEKYLDKTERKTR